MADRDMPELRDTGRRYLDETQRPRLASPGVERWVPERHRGGRGAALLAIAAAVAALAWLIYGR